MSFFVRIKGCVNFHETIPVHKNAYWCGELFCHWGRFLKTTASRSNLIPPCFYYLTNLGRFGVWFLSTGGSYLPASTVVSRAQKNHKNWREIHPPDPLLITFLLFVRWQRLIDRNVCKLFSSNRGISHLNKACWIDELSRGSVPGPEILINN